MALTTTTAALGPSGLLAIEGELDLAASGAVRAGLADLLTQGVTSVVLDVGGVTFMDAFGLKLLLECQARAAAAGISCELAGAGLPVTRVLALTGTSWRRLDLTG